MRRVYTQEPWSVPFLAGPCSQREEKKCRWASELRQTIISFVEMTLAWNSQQNSLSIYPRIVVVLIVGLGSFRT